MASLNKVFLMGNLTRDPELRYTPSGSAVASFGLAVNRKYKQGEEIKDETCFIDITVWGKQAENCAEYLSKGRGILVEGRLSYRTWETEEGQKRSKIEVVANNVQFLPRGGEQPVSKGAETGDLTPEKESVENDVPF
ncbi:MAG: single-stranded DNA-binding protein [Nitrospinota bacterium]|jgi:single-strand DNA-binding protein|nr:MAG: single-stranded DNA-binding protein [Nitrospinae bacterium RIFCSPHIGHO2_02_39_11]OGV98793.1 MAG: single-stranded DNA-binding protein [Nitrospinae bacterium RIFCSPHIGHO2_12_FULL_39_42]OGV99896.1 MAG: single-stranded DNA-binding protein [Nitrospinae bacterium RIFCSPHIGHO2_02_FULL_39_82]OGW04153.1 MAG: single-stranded DNA-binding protein [Nitrospinae bacterium RIFCSPLOWO2_02_FULL_39_110]OGW06476.1 MAG: single-stranded DNA-binding protein [Nitrospinae bacterium RIFCSPLOWO2_02_39_17]OGW0916